MRRLWHDSKFSILDSLSLHSAGAVVTAPPFEFILNLIGAAMNSEKRVKFKTGSQVQWKWMGRTVLGTVRKAFPTPITLEIKGKSITRKGSDENPAYLVESEAGNQALKLATELETRDAKSNKSTKSQPSLFKGTAGKSTRESN